MTTARLLVKLNYQLFVIRNSEFLHCKDGTFIFVACDTNSIVEGSQRKDNLFLNSFGWISSHFSVHCNSIVPIG